jgi:hypothetical protein
MCDPMSMGMMGGSLLGGLLASRQQAASIPAPAPVDAPPASQAAQTPDTATVQAEMKGAGQAGGSSGPGQTFLTPTGGIDPNSLLLDKKKLLL